MTPTNMAQQDGTRSIAIGAGVRFLRRRADRWMVTADLGRLKRAGHSRRSHGEPQFVDSAPLDLADPLTRYGVAPAELVESRPSIVEPTREQNIALT